MKVINFILTGLLISSSSYANCDAPVSYLKKNQPANCTGYLFSPEKEREVRELSEKYPVLVEIVQKQDDLITKLSEQVELNQNIASNLRQEVNVVKSNNTMNNVIYFFLGMAVAVGVNKVMK